MTSTWMDKGMGVTLLKGALQESNNHRGSEGDWHLCACSSCQVHSENDRRGAWYLWSVSVAPPGCFACRLCALLRCHTEGASLVTLPLAV